MKVRFHRSGLAESMATLFESKTYEELLSKIQENFPLSKVESARCELYADTPDERIGWQETWIIEIPDKANCFHPVAFADHDINELKTA